MGALDLPDGQQLARTLWGTRASGEAFDRKKSSYLTEQARTFIEQQSFCIVAGVDFHHELGGLVVPGEAGFVQMPDEQTCWLSLPCSLSTTRLGRKLLQSNEKSQPARLGL